MMPLEGIKVLDLAIMYAGPGATTYLGDMGAEVIKIEQPAGDDSRSLGVTPYLGRNSRFFMAVNRNKRGMVLDLRQPAGKEVLYRLIRETDVLLHNFRPGVAERLGVDYGTLSKLNPRLIYAWLTAFGSKGPYSDKPAYDNVIQGYSGVYAARALRDGAPTGAGTFISDTTTPMLFGFAIGAALWVRERTGRGQVVETSLLSLAMATQAGEWVRVRDGQADEDDPYGDDAAQRLCPVLLCADGQYVALGLVQDAEWLALCRALGRTDLPQDSRFATREGRARYREALHQLLVPAFAGRPSQEWVADLQTAGVPCVQVVARLDVASQEYISVNEVIAPVQHPVVGATRYFNVPVGLSETPGSIRRAAPTLGQDTDAILAEVGYAPEEIKSLRESNVVA